MIAFFLLNCATVAAVVVSADVAAAPAAAAAAVALISKSAKVSIGDGCQLARGNLVTRVWRINGSSKTTDINNSSSSSSISSSSISYVRSKALAMPMRFVQEPTCLRCHLQNLPPRKRDAFKSATATPSCLLSSHPLWAVSVSFLPNQQRSLSN